MTYFPAVETLTGDAAAMYLNVLFDAANTGSPVDARAVARDALLAQRSNRKAMTRLRMAHLRVRVVPRVRPRVRCAARRFHVKTAARRCKAAGSPGRPVGVRRRG